MKKIYVIVAALAVVFSANAQMGFLEGSKVDPYKTPAGASGNFNCGTKAWVSSEPAVNQRFTYAITVTDPAVLTWLSTAGRTLALADFRSAVNEGVNKTNIRLVKVPGTNTYAIDMVIKQIFPSIDFSSLNDDNKYIHFQLTGADFTGNSTWEYNLFGYGNFAVAVAAGADAPAIDWVEGVAPAENYDVPGGIDFAPCTISGIGDVTVDGKIIVGYYSILGVKLDDAPATGIFIEKYSDGTSAKIVK